MSAGNGDDDIRDELENLTGELGELNRLLRAMIQGASEEAGVEEDTGPDDRWDVGTTAISVDTVQEYKEERRVAASSNEYTVPALTKRVWDSPEEQVVTRLDLFEQGFDSLQSTQASLGVSKFEMFVWELAVRKLIPEEVEEGVDITRGDLRELLRIGKPGTDLFGITNIQTGLQTGTQGNLTLDSRRNPFNFLEAYGEFYAPGSEPWFTLGIDQPEDVGLFVGDRSPQDMIQAIAKAAYMVEEGDLPARFVPLLPDNLQDEWLEEQE